MLSDIATPALVIVLALLILRRMDKRMDAQDGKIDNQPSREYCDLQHKTVEDRLDKGEGRFKDLQSEINHVNKTLANVDKNVALLLDRDKRSREGEG